MRTVLGAAARSATSVVGLFWRGKLHLPRDRVGERVTLSDGRTYVVFRESTCDAPAPERPVMLLVWFRLRWIPPGARLRRWLFERLSILNTLLFAGFEGYLVKLWMVNPATSDYSGLYSWRSAESAERYAAYITAVLRPLSSPGTVGSQVSSDVMLEDSLAPSPG